LEKNIVKKFVRGDKPNRSHWAVFHKCCEVYCEIRSGLNGGMIARMDGAEVTLIDFKCDFELIVRKFFKSSVLEREFYFWLGSQTVVGAEKYVMLGKQFLGKGLYPIGASYFTTIKGRKSYINELTSMHKMFVKQEQQRTQAALPKVKAVKVVAEPMAVIEAPVIEPRIVEAAEPLVEAQEFDDSAAGFEFATANPFANQDLSF
jgi:hypothetical protein